MAECSGSFNLVATPGGWTGAVALGAPPTLAAAESWASGGWGGTCSNWVSISPGHVTFFCSGPGGSWDYDAVDSAGSACTVGPPPPPPPEPFTTIEGVTVLIVFAAFLMVVLGYAVGRIR